MRILVITDSYPPEVRSASHLMKDLAEALSARGNEVTVLTSYPRYNLAEGIGEFPRVLKEGGVTVLRVKTPPHHKVHFIIRGFVQLSLPYVFSNAFKDIQKPDMVYVHIPPLPLARIGAMAKRRFGAKLAVNVHDIFPQHVVDLGMLRTFVPFSGPILKWFFERMERKAYRAADVLVVPSAPHAEFLARERGIDRKKIAVVPHWVNLGEFDAAGEGSAKKEIGLEGKFVIFFGGVLGPSQYLEFALDVAERVLDIPDLAFLFAGDGTERARLEALAKERKLGNVRFIPFVPKERFPSLAMAMDVGLVCLSPKNTTPIFPGKIPAYMAAKLPVLAFVNKESIGATLVGEAGCGYVVPSTDKERAIEAVRKMYAARGEELRRMGERGYAYAKERLTADAAAGTIARLFA